MADSAKPLLIALASVLLIACDSTETADGPSLGGGGSGASSVIGGAGAFAPAGGEGGVGAAYVPEPIPDIPDEPPAPCQAAIDMGSPFQFLDDLCEAKRFPSYEDRDLTCPVRDDSATIPLLGGGSVTYLPFNAVVEVDSSALVDIVPSDLDVTVILIRRVDGVPHYRYLSNGTHDNAYQPWSTTKFLAAANAASTLRLESGDAVGLTASVDGQALGDFVTSIANYDYDPYSSNSLGRYFHNIGGRAKANALIHADWLGRPANETFGGNYGEAAPGLGYTFVEEGGGSVTIGPDGSAGPANHLSSFTMAEATKRLVLHREEPGQRLPGIQWADIQTLLYGAEGSSKGPFGGLSQDKAIYFQSGHDIDYIEARSHGQWRIFSKLGNGTDGQFLDVGYACLPVLDDNELPVPGWGRELVIAAHLPTGGTPWKERDRLLATYFRAIIERVVDGRL